MRLGRSYRFDPDQLSVRIDHLDARNVFAQQVRGEPIGQQPICDPVEVLGGFESHHVLVGRCGLVEIDNSTPPEAG